MTDPTPPTTTFASRTSSREWPAEVQAVMDAIAQRMSWPSMHWGTEDVHPDAWPHIAAAALDSLAAVVAEKTAEVERLREYIEGWKGENALIARQRDAQVEKTIRAWTDRDQALGVVAAVKALVDEWEREWEYLGRVGHAAVPAARLRAVLGPVSGAVEGACVHCGWSRDSHSEDREACTKAGYYGNRYTPDDTTPVAEHEQEVRAGVRALAPFFPPDTAIREDAVEEREFVPTSLEHIVEAVLLAARTPEAGS